MTQEPLQDKSKQRNPSMRREPPQFPPQVIAELRKARLQREQQDALSRYNENHDARGRFAEGGGSEGGGGGGNAAAQLRALEQKMSAKHPQTIFDFTGADPALMEGACQQLHQLMKAYPEVGQALGYFGTGNNAPKGYEPNWQEKSSVAAYSRAYKSGTTPYSVILLNPRFFGNAAVASGTMSRMTQAGYLASGAMTGGLNYIVAHEYGHIVDAYLQTRGSIARRKGVQVSAQLAAFQASNAHLGPQISRYAATAPVEAFAEGFASLHFAPSHQQAAYTQNLGTFLDTVLPGGSSSKWKKWP